MRLVRWSALAVLVLALGACNAISQATGGGAQRPAISDLAGKAGCAVIVDSPSPNAAEEGTCDGLVITTFESQENRDKWLQSSSGTGGPYLVGDLWIVSGGDKPALETLKGRMGGDVRD
jgi:hypothetical protein